MRFIRLILAIIIIWLTVAAQPDNNIHDLDVFRNKKGETLNVYDFAKELRPSTKL